MIEESFKLDDDFNKIISDTLKDEGIDKVDKIETISHVFVGSDGSADNRTVEVRDR